MTGIVVTRSGSVLYIAVRVSKSLVQQVKLGMCEAAGVGLERCAAAVVSHDSRWESEGTSAFDISFPDVLPRRSALVRAFTVVVDAFDY